jgi:SAM-dependent methyltransferase
MEAVFNISFEWKRQVAASFSKAAPRYEKIAHVQKKAADFLADQLVRFVERPFTILEFGAGTGYLTRRLLQSFDGSNITSIDLSSAMLDELRKTLSEKERKRVTVCIADMDEFENGSPFSVVCSSFALQWSSNPLALLADCAYHLEKGGMLAHIFPIRGSLRSLLLNGYLRPIPSLFLSLEDCVRSMQGFDIIFAKSFEIYQQFETPLKALHHIKVLGGSKGPSLGRSLFKIRKNRDPIICEWSLGCLIARKK